MRSYNFTGGMYEKIFITEQQMISINMGNMVKGKRPENFKEKNIGFKTLLQFPLSSFTIFCMHTMTVITAVV